MRLRGRISLAIGGVALASSVLLVGSALRWTQAIVSVLVAFALVAQLPSRRRLDRVSPILVLIGIAIALTALQLVPLPHAVVAALDGTGAGLRAEGAQIAGTSPWSCLSLDPPGTLRALAFFITLFGVASLSLWFAASEGGRYYLIVGVVLTCGLCAAVTGVHSLLGATSLYGVYDPSHASPPILGPLLNANHLGGLMAFGAILAIGLAFYERQASQLRVLWLVIALGCVLVVFGSLSRGATIGLVLGVLAAGAMIVGARLGARDQTTRQRRRGLARDLPMGIVIAIGLAGAIYTSAGEVADQIDNTTLDEMQHPLSKFEAWKSSFELVKESPWVGVGRGAVEPTLTRVHEASAYATFSHLENEYVTAVVEWGIPGALVLAIVLGWCCATAARRWRDGPLQAAALGAVACVMFQSSVDFGVEIFGLAIPTTIVAATLLTVPYRETRALTRLRMHRGILIAATFGAAVLVLLPAARSLQEDHDDMLARQPSLADLRDELERHPLDYFGFAETADLMMRTDDARAAHVLNHALQLHPTHAGLHRLAARMLITSGRKQQAAAEYSAALHSTLVPKPLLGEITAMLPDARDAASAIPVDWEPEEMIERTLRELKRPDVLLRWYERIVDGPVFDTQIADAGYALALAIPDLDAAKHIAERRVAVAHTYTSRLMLARVLLQRKELAPILSDLADVSKWHHRTDEHSEAWLILCDALGESGEYDKALDCVHKLDATGMMFAKRADLLKREKDLEERRAVEIKLHELDVPPPPP